MGFLDSLRNLFMRARNVVLRKPTLEAELTATPSYAEKLAEIQEQISIQEAQVAALEEAKEHPEQMPAGEIPEIEEIEPNFFWERTEYLKKRARPEAPTYYYYLWECTCQVSQVQVIHQYATTFYSYNKARLLHNTHYPDHKLIDMLPLAAYEREMK